MEKQNLKGGDVLKWKRGNFVWAGASVNFLVIFVGLSAGSGGGPVQSKSLGCCCLAQIPFHYLRIDSQRLRQAAFKSLVSNKLCLHVSQLPNKFVMRDLKAYQDEEWNETRKGKGRTFIHQERSGTISPIYLS